MSNAQNAIATESAANETKKAKPSRVSFGKRHFDLTEVNKALESMSSEMGDYRKLAAKHGLLKEVVEDDGETVELFVNVSAALKKQGLISTEQARDMVAFKQAMKALQVVLTFETRKAQDVLKKTRKRVK